MPSLHIRKAYAPDRALLVTPPLQNTAAVLWMARGLQTNGDTCEDHNSEGAQEKNDIKPRTFALAPTMSPYPSTSISSNHP